LVYIAFTNIDTTSTFVTPKYRHIVDILYSLLSGLLTYLVVTHKVVSDVIVIP